MTQEPEQRARIEELLTEVRRVIALCESQPSDGAIDHGLMLLRHAESSLLRGEVPGNLGIGPFAAKNLDDWNPELAGELMSLHARLRG